MSLDTALTQEHMLFYSLLTQVGGGGTFPCFSEAQKGGPIGF